MKIGIKLIKNIEHPAKLPTQKSGDIGWDLYATNYAEIMPGMHPALIHTGVILANWPQDLVSSVSSKDASTVFAKVEGRSSLAKRGVITVGGIIDSSYRGEIVVMLASLSDSVSVKPGDKIAQLVFYRALGVDCGFELEETGEIQQTGRGSNGFGSTGA